MPRLKTCALYHPVQPQTGAHLAPCGANVADEGRDKSLEISYEWLDHGAVHEHDQPQEIRLACGPTSLELGFVANHPVPLPVTRC